MKMIVSEHGLHVRLQSPGLNGDRVDFNTTGVVGLWALSVFNGSDGGRVFLPPTEMRAYLEKCLEVLNKQDKANV